MDRTCEFSSVANAQPNCAVNVLFPTPPLPLSTRIFRLTDVIRSLINGSAGSGPLGFEDAQISWLAQPAQASDLPACSDSGPCANKHLQVGSQLYCFYIPGNVQGHSLEFPSYWRQQ